MVQIAFLSLGYLALFDFYGGVGLLLQERIGDIEPTHKAVVLAIVAGVAALCVLFANPIGGALSDRTTSPLGRRAPWLLVGSVTGGLASLVLARAETIVGVAVAACAALAAINLYQAALAALIPDAIAIRLRGRASAAIGAASVVGWALGTQIVATWPHGLVAVALLASGVFLTAVVLTVFLARSQPEALPISDPADARESHAPRLNLRSVFTHDFARVFASRALMMFSYSVVLVYLLYVVEDFVHRPSHMTAASAVAEAVAVGGCFALVVAGLAGTFSDRHARYRLPAEVAGCVGGVALLIPVASQTWGAFLVFCAIEGGALGSFYAVDTALATLVLPDTRSVGRDLGILNIAATAPPVLAPIVAALVVGLVGYGGLFPVAAVGAIVAALSLRRVTSIQ
jgi:MFS family permease